MDVRFKYETYQDVRHNLFLYSIPFLVSAGFFTFFWILPPSHQAAVQIVLDRISSAQPWKGFLGTGFGLVVFGVFAFLITEVLQVHDQWYDKYIVRWRHRYATEFILPRLTQPWLSRTNRRFYETAEIHAEDFQRELFYPFVGDRDNKIPINDLIRFYEVVTVYWLTQINEIVLLLIIAIIVFYRFQGPVDLTYRTLLLNGFVIVGSALLLNRIWVRSSRGKVQRATEEEIRAIHDDAALREDLERRFARLCRHYSIPYGQAAQD